MFLAEGIKCPVSRLWQELFKLSWRFARAHGLSHHDAEDVAGDCVRRILSNAHRIRSVEAVKSYIWLATLNLIRDRYHYNQRRPVIGVA